MATASSLARSCCASTRTERRPEADAAAISHVRLPAMSSEPVPTGLAALDPEYWILGEIGRGGTAVVYLARDRATGDEVAIKLIRAKYLEDEEAIARFAREARFVAQLDHPNVVGVREVLDLGTAGIALVMTHIDGRTLKQLIQEERPLRRDRVVLI